MKSKMIQTLIFQLFKEKNLSKIPFFTLGKFISIMSLHFFSFVLYFLMNINILKFNNN